MPKTMDVNAVLALLRAQQGSSTDPALDGDLSALGIGSGSPSRGGLLGGIRGLLGSASKPGTDGTSFLDRLNALGASLRADPSYGRDADADLLAKQQLAQQAPLLKAKLGLLSQFQGPQPGVSAQPSGQPDASRGLTASDPNALGESGLPVLDTAPMTAAPPAAAAAPGSSFDRQRRALAGLSVLDGKYGDAYTALKPDVFVTPTGEAIDKNDTANVGRVFPMLDKGQGFTGGRVTNLPGAVDAARDMTAATAGATESAKADLDVIQIPTANGGTISMPRGQYVTLSKLGALGPGVGVGQGTGAKAYAEAAGSGAGGAPYAKDDRVDENGNPVYGVMSDRLHAAGVAGPSGGAPLRGQNPANAEYQKNNAKAESDRFGTIQTAAQSVPTKRSNLQQLGALLQGVDGGSLTPTGLEIASTLNSIGVHVDPKLGNKQAAAALSNTMALAARSTADGGGMPGAMSDADRKFLQASVPGLMQSAAGRQQIIDYQLAILSRQERMAKAASQWSDRFGRLSARDSTGKNFDDYWSAYTRTKPLFGGGQ